ncbi:MAG TPA: thioredoxin domain-containing protein [Myxococcaceae bacterium]|nr:thioredoxin domain-containing protein [Myxococcaceae bacterium]
MKFSAFVSLVLGVVLGIVIGRATLSQGSARPEVRPQTAQQQQQQQRTPPRVDPTVWRIPVEGSPVAGSPDALVTLVEFTDYECPYCGRAHGTIQQLQKDYGAKLRVVMKENPLTMHPHARGAAMAALAAGAQGKYWPMHDRLFANQRALEAPALAGYAQELGLDSGRFQSDLHNPDLEKIIDRDLELGAGVGVSGTPAIFINGRRLPGGAAPIENFKALIEEELAKAEAMVRAGTPPAQVYARILEKGQEPGTKPVVKVDAPADAPAFGPAYPKVTIVEWSDFQCPYCSRAVPTVEKVRDLYGKDVRVVFRNFPLSTIHPNARIAAQAAMAAHAQGKFWPMHDRLFANQGALDRASLERTAEQIGLDMKRFRSDFDSAAVDARIEADVAAATAAGVRATPSFFVNGRLFEGAPPLEQLRLEIDREIAKADKLLAQGVKPENLYSRLLADSQAPAARK